MSDFLVISSAVKWEEVWACDYEASLEIWWPGSNSLSATSFLCECQQVPYSLLDFWNSMQMWDFSQVYDKFWKSDKESSAFFRTKIVFGWWTFSSHSVSIPLCKTELTVISCRWDKNTIGGRAEQTVLHYMGAIRKENVLLYLALGHGDTHV